MESKGGLDGQDEPEGGPDGQEETKGDLDGQDQHGVGLNGQDGSKGRSRWLRLDLFKCRAGPGFGPGLKSPTANGQARARPGPARKFNFLFKYSILIIFWNKKTNI